MTWNDGTPYVEELAEGIFAYVQPDGGWMVNNSGIITDRSGDAVLVDTTSTEKRTRALLSEVTRIAPRGPKVVVNTHSHPDHVYGNCFLPPTTTIIGHHLCREIVLRAGLAATQELPADYGDLSIRPPDLTVDHDLTLHLDDFPVELMVLGPAHTSHDIAVWAPEQGVLFSGDLAFAGGHPMFLDGSLTGFQAAMRRMRELGAEVLMPGHGPVRRGAEVDALLADQEAYADWIASVATESYAAGLTPLRAAEQALAADTPYRDRPEAERVVCNVYRAYAELTDFEPEFPLNVPHLWPDMIALHGGPITCHA